MFEESSVRDREDESTVEPRMIRARMLAGRVDAEKAEVDALATDQLLNIVNEQATCPEVIAIRHWIATGELPVAWRDNSKTLRAKILMDHVARRAAKFVRRLSITVVWRRWQTPPTVQQCTIIQSL